MQIFNAIRLTIETCERKHLSFSTQQTYTHWLKRYGLFLKARTPAPQTTEQKIESFLTMLAGTGISAATQNQAFSALLFFYRDVLHQQFGAVDALRARRPATLRDCPSMAEVRQLLASVTDMHGYPTRLIVHLLYACGLRVTEPLNFRIKDLDLAQARFYVQQAKGKKGRVVRFPDCLSAPLAKQLEIAKSFAATDRAQGIPVALPDLLAKKYPYAAHAERWAWLFPSRTTCQHPRTKQIVRWRCHEANVQRAVKQAAHRCQLDGITPHHLRHAFATHSLQNGSFVRDLQVVLGHNCLETTMRYLHTEAERVTSPLREFVSVPGMT
jgi:site-specific recombinase XerD